MASAVVHRVLILSRSCNLDWKKQIQVAPVFPTDGVEAQALSALRENDNAFSFYLPPYGRMSESYADLSQMATVHVSYLRRTDFLVSRLAGPATVALQDVLSEYYARPFGFDVKDRVPQKATYRCAGCFFSGETECPILENAPVGDNFPACPKCQQRALWVKLEP